MTYKTWWHLDFLFKHYELKHFYKIMLETKESLILTYSDGYYLMYIAIQKTSDKCYRMILAKKMIFSDKQYDVYKSFRELYQIAEFLHEIKCGTLPPLAEIFSEQKPKKDKRK